MANDQIADKILEEEEGPEMSFLDHLEELRWHIIRSALAVVLFAVIAFVLKGFIFDTVILKPMTPEFWTNRMLVNI